MRFLAIGLAMALAACGGSSSVVITEPPAEELGPLVHGDYEQFDPTPYEDEAVARPERLVHDVPEALWQSRADAGVEQTVAGYRVQVLATLDPREAESMQARLVNWWEGQRQRLSPDSSLPATMEVYRLFRQPYYRIRIGDLTRRDAAQELLTLVSRSFDGAFIVPDRVTVRR